jgi:hypothetical protein
LKSLGYREAIFVRVSWRKYERGRRRERDSPPAIGRERA